MKEYEGVWRYVQVYKEVWMCMNAYKGIWKSTKES